MIRGDKAKYTEAQKRQAEHIENSYEAKGASHSRAEAIAWATVNKQTGGGEKSGSGARKSQISKTHARQDSAKNAVKTKQEKSDLGSYESQTKANLLVVARQKNIKGRSVMSKQDLILALRKP